MKRRNVERSKRRNGCLSTFASVALIATLQSGCAEQRGPEPPVMYFGQHECDVCRMIISEDRYAAALVIESSGGAGRYEHRRFDDIGCLFQFEINEPDHDIVARYVSDARSGQWLDAETAVYLHSMSLKTPMAFHLAGFPAREDAVAMQQEHAGDIIDFTTARERFKAGTLRDF